MSEHKLSDNERNLFFKIAKQHVLINFRTMINGDWPHSDALIACLEVGDGQKALRDYFGFSTEDIRQLIVTSKKSN